MVGVQVALVAPLNFRVTLSVPTAMGVPVAGTLTVNVPAPGKTPLELKKYPLVVVPVIV